MASLISPSDLDIDMTTDQGLFDWLLASILFGRPVPQKTAATAFRQFKDDGWDAPDRFTATDRAPLWHELYEGNYHRMSSVMAKSPMRPSEPPERPRGGQSDLVPGDYVAVTRRHAAPLARTKVRVASTNGHGVPGGPLR